MRVFLLHRDRDVDIKPELRDPIFTAIASGNLFAVANARRRIARTDGAVAMPARDAALAQDLELVEGIGPDRAELVAEWFAEEENVALVRELASLGLTMTAGEAERPAAEPVRLGQDPELAFAPAPLAWFGAEPGAAKPRLQVRLFGLFGPNGPLPLHVTEFARDRLHNAADRTLCRFLDVFHHRFVAGEI